MTKVPQAVSLAVSAAAARLRERAFNVRPDEDLAASIAANADAGDAFARAYAALRELGLEDKSLDQFGLENATATEIRTAAFTLEQLALAEAVPGRRRGRNRSSLASSTWQRISSIFVGLLLSLPFLLFATGFFMNAREEFISWRHERNLPVQGSHPGARELPQGSATRPVRQPEILSPPLAPVGQGFEKTGSNLIVPAQPRDFVTDRAGVLSPDAARALNGELLQFEEDTSNQVIVFIDRRLPAETTLEDLASSSIHQWGVGQKGKDNGVIFFVFADDHKLRIEVGYGLESTLTDARAQRIINQIVKPLAQRGKLADGIVTGTEAIVDVARGGEAAEAFAAAAAGTASHSSIKGMALLSLLSTACLAIAFLILRSLFRFLKGGSSGLFPVSFAGSGSGGSGSSSGWDSSSSGSDSGSYSGGGGDGGGGGASGSW
ncbi:MAG: TPM domain-containing protein [Acidobacteriota bacterium]